MTSATPAPAACGAQLTTIQVDPNTSARLYTILNSQATPMLICPTRYLHASQAFNIGRYSQNFKLSSKYA